MRKCVALGGGGGKFTVRPCESWDQTQTVIDIVSKTRWPEQQLLVTQFILNGPDGLLSGKLCFTDLATSFISYWKHWTLSLNCSNIEPCKSAPSIFF